MLKLVTWNVRNRNATDAKNGYGWEVRLPRISAMLNAIAPDLVAVQEAFAGQMDDLGAALPEFEAVGVGRDDGAKAGEYTGIFLRRKRFALRDFRTRWLSATPDIPSVGWDAALPRIVTCARLFDRQAEREFELWNTHFDHRGPTARVESARYLRREIGQLDVPALLCGDFNALPDSAPIAELLEEEKGETLRNARDHSRLMPTGELATFRGFDVAPLRGNEHLIDYVFASRDWQIESYAVPALRGPEFPLPSDHRPVAVELNCK